jgi:hypothetical protein
MWKHKGNLSKMLRKIEELWIQRNLDVYKSWIISKRYFSCRGEIELINKGMFWPCQENEYCNVFFYKKDYFCIHKFKGIKIRYVRANDFLCRGSNSLNWRYTQNTSITYYRTFSHEIYFNSLAQQLRVLSINHFLWRVQGTSIIM